ncbi:MAG: FAD-dependent oxidoreductase [Desulfobacteraceae bacterium]|jgi:NADPH-dependent 2,4-dienoyl-CoA reductase/sulfur reductase-like enzyme/rhodanese-related sulfurtransferase
MGKKVVIIGGVALGPKVACRIKRLDPTADVVVVDKDEHISYGGCGIPYYVGGDVADIEGLMSTSAHVLRDSRFFAEAKGVEVRIRTEAVRLDRERRVVHLRSLVGGEESELAYDELVLGTGAIPIVPPLPGVDLPGVSVVATLNHAQKIKEAIAKGQVGRAVVIGAGAIGIEMAEALTDLWGVETTLVEMQQQVLPTAIGVDMARVMEAHLREKSVDLRLGTTVLKILGDQEAGVTGVETSAGEIPSDLVILAVGVRPNSRLAKEAGLTIGPIGGIQVDEHLRTSDPKIYAGGDCVEMPHLVSGAPIHLPLGSIANRHGRVIGTNVTGGNATFPGVVGNFCIKIFDLALFTAGLTEDQAQAAGFDAISTVSAQADRAHFYPSQDMMVMKLIACRKTGRILGVESFGSNGDAVKARVDSIAALLPHKPSVADISNLEVAYSPPFASAMDIINSAANALENTIERRHIPVDVGTFLELFKTEKAKVLDVRSAVQAGPFVEKYGDRWQNIPQEELAGRIAEVDPDEDTLYLICGSGPRSYEAQLLLRQKGITDTLNIQGGIKMLKSTDPDFTPDT